MQNKSVGCAKFDDAKRGCHYSFDVSFIIDNDERDISVKIEREVYLEGMDRRNRATKKKN